jgi:hypothetical protein
VAVRLAESVFVRRGGAAAEGNRATRADAVTNATGLLFRVSHLCLSRACLGKMIIFESQPKGRPKKILVFLPGLASEKVPMVDGIDRRQPGGRLQSRRFSTFPVFVPSRSRQNEIILV